MTRKLYSWSITLLLLFACYFVKAQVQLDQVPISWTIPFQKAYPAFHLSTLELPAPPVEKWLKEDQSAQNPRFAGPIAVNYNLENAGQWLSLEHGDRLWLCKIKVAEAQALAVFFQNIKLPVGSRLWIRDPDGEQIHGAYSHRNQSEAGLFTCPFVQGDELVIEYYEPFFASGEGNLEIFRLDYAYQDAFEKVNFGFGTANNCHININCPEGDPYQTIKRGTCRIRMTLEEGTGWCSGSMLNNTAEDGRPFVLSAFHCQDGYTPIYDLWRFDFNYESSTCGDPFEEPSFQSVLGAVQRAGRETSDFLLLEITNPIPPSYLVYFNGWDRSGAAPDSSVLISHPSGDIKKIALDYSPNLVFPSSINWNNGVTTPPNHHIRAELTQGSFEVGSSGGPLFDQNDRVVGQLHGGIENCTESVLYCGRFFQSWDSGQDSTDRLDYWLDPLGTGQLTLDGYEPPLPTMAALSGQVRTETGQGVAGVTVVLSGFFDQTLETDTSGMYQFEDLPVDQFYQIQYFKDTARIDNGVTTIDNVFIQRHILGIDPFTSPYKILAGDTNNSNSLTTLDIVYVRLVILLLEDAFPNNTSWKFIPAAYQFPNPDDPFANPIPNTIVINNLTGNISGIDIIGVKIGDVNNSANPAE